MMLAFAELLRQSPFVCVLLSCFDNVLGVAGCAMAAKALFRLSLRRNPMFYVLCAALCIAYGALPSGQSGAVDILFTVFGVAFPFFCMALLFQAKGLWKALLTAAGYTLVDAVKYIVLLVFFNFDYNVRNEELELLISFCVDMVFCVAAFLLLSSYVKRDTGPIDVTKNGAVLFLLIVLSFAVLVTTFLVMGSGQARSKQSEFGFMLLNIPLLTATATFALVRFFRMRNEAEKYKYQLDMQIRQFEWMEQMVDDVRIFRHDFPKKMRPLIALLDENRSEDAKQIAEQFTDFTAQSGERFHTGNYCLDTVLFCEQQLAERVGATIDVPYHTVFPKDGIASDDIYTIFPNALDNAIEACRAVQGEKKIEFRSRFDKQAVFVSIRNPVAEDVRVKNGLPQTNKPDKASHGYGFRSLKKAAAKYGEDNVSFSVENGVFELRIFLNYTTQGGSGK